MTEFERRLSGWQPDSAGVDVDAVLFAAGRASMRPGSARLVWPGLTALLTGLAIVLGLWLAIERNERMALTRRLQERPPAPAVNPSPPPADDTAPAESPALDEAPPDGYLVSRRALEMGLDAWPSRLEARGGPTEASSRNSPILRVGQRDALLDP